MSNTWAEGPFRPLNEASGLMKATIRCRETDDYTKKLYWMLTIEGSGTPFTVEHTFPNSDAAERWARDYAAKCHQFVAITIVNLNGTTTTR